jgi:hypothetical protein
MPAARHDSDGLFEVGGENGPSDFVYDGIVKQGQEIRSYASQPE